MLEPARRSLLPLSPHGFHRVVYYEWGDSGARDVVVCVHALTRNGRDFDDLARALAPSFRVLCPDMPGRGESEWLADPHDYGPATYLGTLTALIAEPLTYRAVSTSLTEAPAPDVSGLIDTLANRIGEERLYRVAPVESDIPERAIRRVMALSLPTGTTWPAHWPRPARLLNPPERVDTVARLHRYRDRLSVVDERCGGDWRCLRGNDRGQYPPPLELHDARSHQCVRGRGIGAVAAAIDEQHTKAAMGQA